jgi:hypothetical protein
LSASDLEDPSRSEEADVELQEEIDLTENDGHCIHLGPSESKTRWSEASGNC